MAIAAGLLLAGAAVNAVGIRDDLVRHEQSEPAPVVEVTGEPA
jgi:hypothetical protein